MALARWQATITNARGDIIPDAMVEVRREGGGLIQLFSDREGIVAKGNPFAADSDGFAFFHAPGGAYRIRAYAGSFERTWRYVSIGLGAETDLTVTVPSGEWDAETVYPQGALVYHGNSTFISRIWENENNEPDAVTPGDTPAWMYAGATVLEQDVFDLAEKAEEEADRAEQERIAAENARDIAAGYASDAVSQGNVPIYATVVGMSSLEVPVGINAIRVNGYYAAGDSGGGEYQVVSVEPTHFAKFKTLDDRWWELVASEPTALQLGCKADYNPADGTGTDNAPFLNSGLARWRVIRGVPGWFMINDTVDGGKYGGIIAPGSATTLGANAEAVNFLDANTRFVLVPRDLPRSHTINAMITECELGGGVVENPNAGKDYTLTSDGRMDTFRLVDFTNRDAVGATPATARQFSAAVKVGRNGFMHGVVARTTREDGAFTSQSDILDFGNAPDIGFYCENPYYAALAGCNATWGFRMYAAVCLNHNNGDGSIPAGDGFRARDCMFEGYRSFGVRGHDRVRIIGATSDSVTIPWFRSHQFGSSGTIRIGATEVAYTGLVFNSGTPDTLTFTGLASVPVGAVGSLLSRGEDYNDSGVGEMAVENTFLRAITHASLQLPTDDAFSDHFDSPSGLIEISGAKVRGVHFRALIAHARDDILAFINDAGTVTFSGYAEPKDVPGTSGASGFIALSREAMEAGVGGVPYPGAGARNVQFDDGWDQTLTIDTSPAFRPQNSVGRFGSDWNLFLPDGASSLFYSKRSRDGTATRFKAPGTAGKKHPFQFVTSGAAMRASMDQSGNWQFGYSLDTENDLTQPFTVNNNGGHLVRAQNTLSTAATGFSAINTAGNAGLIVDSNGRGQLRQNSISRVEWGSAWFSATTDNNLALGQSSARWSNGYIRQIRPGAGTALWTSGEGDPNGSVSAPVGSLYTRTDGGASTTFYVKESGTGSSGWVAK